MESNPDLAARFGQALAADPSLADLVSAWVADAVAVDPLLEDVVRACNLSIAMHQARASSCATRASAPTPTASSSSASSSAARPTSTVPKPVASSSSDAVAYASDDEMAKLLAKHGNIKNPMMRSSIRGDTQPEPQVPFWRRAFWKLIGIMLLCVPAAMLLCEPAAAAAWSLMMCLETPPPVLL